MNALENLARKENGIIFDKVYIPNMAKAENIALWKAGFPHHMRFVTNGGIEIERVSDLEAKLKLTMEERELLITLLHGHLAAVESLKNYYAASGRADLQEQSLRLERKEQHLKNIQAKLIAGGE